MSGFHTEFFGGGEGGGEVCGASIMREYEFKEAGGRGNSRASTLGMKPCVF